MGTSGTEGGSRGPGWPRFGGRSGSYSKDRATRCEARTLLQGSCMTETTAPLAPLEEMAAWVDFTAEDEGRLRALWPLVEREMSTITDTFYERILSNPTARAVFHDEAQIARQKRTLQQWMKELLLGPRDEAYVERRERVGRVHVEVGLPSRYMFMSMNVVRVGLCEAARRAFPSPEDDLVCRAVQRACDMDLAIMTGTYVERREARQIATLQGLIVSHLPVTVLLLDAEGRVTAATRPGTRLFGDRPVLNRRYDEALPPTLLEASRFGEHLERATSTGREIVLSRVDAVIDGQDRSFSLALVPLNHPQARTLVHVEELTDTIATEARLRRSESLAQLGALSAAVAHELRNPLAGISGAVQVMARSLPAEDRRKPIMEKVEQQVRRLDLLVTDLLQFARPTEARRARVQLDDVARIILEPLAREHRGVRLQVRGAGAGIGDSNLIQQILLNLVLNAVQALTGEDGTEAAGRVTIEVADGEIAVVDSGPGVPAELVEQIFTPFFTTRTRGTGLGLAICRKLAGAMDGTLEVTRDVEGGARFCLTLPRTE